MLSLSMIACDPCSTTIGCRTSPRLSITGQVLDETSGKGVRSRVEMVYESGVALTPPTAIVQTGSNGVFDVSADAGESGQSVVRLVVTPDDARPFIVRSIVVSTVNIRGDALVVSPWTRPTLPYAFHIARASNGASIDSAIVQFQRTGGPELRLGGTPASVVVTATGEVGYAFPFENVTADSTGVVTGVLSVQVKGLAVPYTTTISVSAIPQFRLQHAQFGISVPGL